MLFSLLKTTVLQYQLWMGEKVKHEEVPDGTWMSERQNE